MENLKELEKELKYSDKSSIQYITMKYLAEIYKSISKTIPNDQSLGMYIRKLCNDLEEHYKI